VAAAAETGFKGPAPWSGAAGQSLPPPGTQRGHTLTRLFALAFLSTDIAIRREGATLAPDDRLALTAGGTFDAPFFDRHIRPFIVTLVFTRNERNI